MDAIFVHSYGNKFQREIILTEKKKIEARILIFEFESRNKGTIATKCKEIQIDGDILVLLHAYAKRKPLEHSFPFFLYGYVCSNLIESMKNCIITVFVLSRDNFPRNFFIIPLVVILFLFLFYRAKTRGRMQLYVSPSGMTSIPAALIL